MHRVGLISDTHGLLRPEAIAFLRGCDHIVHAGDIGDAGILATLSMLAPLTAVRGNNDVGEWAAKIPERALVEIGGVGIHVLHDIAEFVHGTRTDNVRVVVAGHSHHPKIEPRDGVLYINPGSAGPRRFRLPTTVGELLIEHGVVSPRIVELVVAKKS